MKDDLNRRHFLATIGAAASCLPLLSLVGCKQEKTAPPKKKIFTDPKLELLDLALQHEYGAIVQYSNHAGIIFADTGGKDTTIMDRIEQIIADEVHHAILISNILVKNKATPTISIWPPQTAPDPLVMLQKDVMAEEGAIDLYEQISTLDLSDYERETVDTISNTEIMHRDVFSDLMDLLT